MIPRPLPWHKPPSEHCSLTNPYAPLKQERLNTFYTDGSPLLNNLELK
jgi:hypothetical protein